MTLEPRTSRLVDSSVTAPVREMILRTMMALLLVSASWFGMQAVHEAGHAFHCLSAGGSIHQVVLHPLEVSRTELRLNPYPSLTAWGGAIWGTIIPVALYWISRLLNSSCSHLARFFAGFCLAVNGIYFVVGSIELGGDPGDLVKFGSNRVWIGVIGALMLSAGLRIWHGLGSAFGLGRPEFRTPTKVIALLAGANAVLISIGLFLFPGNR